MKAWLRVAALEIEAFEVLIYIGGTIHRIYLGWESGYNERVKNKTES